MKFLIIEQKMTITYRLHKHFNKHRWPRHNLFWDTDPNVGWGRHNCRS